MQTIAGPDIGSALAGAPDTVRLRTAPYPHALPAVTVIAPVVNAPLKLTRIVLVTCPLVIVAHDGTVHW